MHTGLAVQIVFASFRTEGLFWFTPSVILQTRQLELAWIAVEEQSDN